MTERLDAELVEGWGANRLLVTFAGVHDGHAPPEAWREEFFAHLPCHRLYIGSSPRLLADPHGGPVLRERLYALIAHTAARLGVPPQNIICQGHSFGGLTAMIAGARTQAGHVFAGAPCVWLGSWIYRLGREGAESAQVDLFSYLFAVSNMQRNLGYLRELDSLAIRELMTGSGGQLRLFASSADSFFRESLWLANELSLRRGSWSVQVTSGTYPEHDLVQYQYYPYLVRELSQILAD